MHCPIERPLSEQFYRFYVLSHDGAVKGAESREFGCDAQALFHAQSMLIDHPAVEVWQTDGLIGVLKRSLLACADLHGGAALQMH